jgi:hypothetical protein
MNAGVRHYRIEWQHYTAEYRGLVTAAFRQELHKIFEQGDKYTFLNGATEKITAAAPRELGVGVFRHKFSK